MVYLQQERNVELPGSFTALQGVPGDGLLNTMDESPDFDECPRSGDGEEVDPKVLTAIEEWKKRCAQNAKDAANEWYHSVANNPQQQPNKGDLAKRQARERIPILYEYASSHKKRWWIDSTTAQLRLFSALPQPVPSATNVAGARTVAPGSICMGIALHTFQMVFPEKQPQDNELQEQQHEWVFLGTCSGCSSMTDKERLPNLHHPRAGILQYLQIESPSTGYVLFSVDGYTVLAPGMADSTLFTGLSNAAHDGGDGDPTTQYWWWKVTCPAGAYVRQGVELTSKHMGTVPFGTHIQVTRKIVNAAGLSRLYIRAPAHGNNNTNNNTGGARMEGWCSELLNPLSGQRGPIVQPIPMAVPVFYKVVLRAGGTVRKAVELSSPVVGREVLPLHTVVPVLGRAYTEFPANGCVPRICLYNKHAYASVRLNRPSAGVADAGASSESFIFKATGECDSTFDPERPGLYHWKLHLQWTPATSDHFDGSGGGGGAMGSSYSSSRPSGAGCNAKCVCCEDKEPNATLVHGETGHICCCLECARVCKAQGLGCPICRLPIDQVIMHFYS